MKPKKGLVAGLLLSSLFLMVCQVTDSLFGQVESPFEVRREFENVWAGADPSNLPRLTDSDWHAFQAGSWVTTDENGEGWLDIDDCLLIYVFQTSQLVKSACPKSDLTSGNVTCSLEGTSAFNNSCGSQVVIQTPSASFNLTGTWVSVTYLPQSEVTIILVPEGNILAQPVTEASTFALESPTTVRAGQFWYTMPDDRLTAIDGLQPRTPHDLSELPAVLDNFQLRPWIYRIQERARRDRVPLITVPPQILAVEVPELIPAQSSANNPVFGTLSFQDPDRDITNARVEVLDSDLRSPGIEVRLPENAVGSSSGELELAVYCRNQSGSVRAAISLLDRAGYESDPFEFAYFCESEPPTETPTPPNLVLSNVEILADPGINAQGQVVFPVLLEIKNLGDLPADPFKLSASFTGPNGTFGTPIYFPGGDPEFYAFIEAPLAGNEDILVEAEILLAAPNQGQEVSVQVLADSCAGEEFVPEFCRVAESDETDNTSTALNLILPANTRPVVSITQPVQNPEQFDPTYRFDGLESGRWYADVRLSGAATDKEDGTLSGSSLVWTTNRTDLQDEVLGTGRTLSTRLYSSQTCQAEGIIGDWHSITLTATDSNGQSSSQTRRIYIWTTCIL